MLLPVSKTEWMILLILTTSQCAQQSTKNDYRNVSNTVSFNVRIKVARPFIGGRVNEDLLKGGVLKS